MNLTKLKQLTRIEQTFFGLPFVIAGALLPFITHTIHWHFHLAWLWIVPAFISARISGMAFNQVIDRYIDAENPRTKMRVVASGALHNKVAFSIAFSALLLFLLSCSQINNATFYFSLLAALLIYVYSYAKRVTLFCHVILGFIHFLAPLMAWVAITGKVTLVPILLSLINMTSIIGVDIIYALQDVEFDKKRGLYSIPVKFGVQGAQGIAQFAHLVCILMIITLGAFCHFTLLYYLCPLIVGFIFLIYHLKADEILQKKEVLQGFDPFFFYCTLLVSLSTLLFILMEWKA